RPEASKPLPAFEGGRALVLAIKDLPAPQVPFGLSLTGDTIVDSDLKELARLEHLQMLKLSATRISGVGLAALGSLRQLYALDASWESVTDQGAKGVAELKHLRFLKLSHADVSDLGLKALSGLKRLQVLDLWGTNIS